jgi:beta-glucosidase
VVLQTGGPVTMPWVANVAAIVEVWYPGARGAEAIANLLFGDVNLIRLRRIPASDA